jgi:hypothetical protein
VTSASASGSHKHEGGSRAGRDGKWLRVSSVVLLFLVTVLLAALTAMFAFGGNNGQEAKYVNKDDYQAVFVNVNGTTGGQVYFGRIKDLTSQYVDLTNVFYIQNQSSGSATSNGAYTLVKLGCELHGPADQMVINNSQVYFWENLKPSGQVTQKINQFYKQNPNGQNCSQSTSNATQSSTNTQASTNASTTTPATSTTTKKP